MKSMRTCDSMAMPLEKYLKSEPVVHALKTSDFDEIEGKNPIDYWRDKHPGRDVEICPACGRKMKPTGREEDSVVGGHVLVRLNHQDHVCITPVCHSCNSKGSPIPFRVARTSLVEVPKTDEKAILAMPENQQQIKALNPTHIHYKIKRLSRK